MSPRLSRLLALIIVNSVWVPLALIEGCGTDSAATGGPGGDDADSKDATIDRHVSLPESGATKDSAASDAGKDSSPLNDGAANGKGETCVGFAKSTPCGENGFPDYGYRCFNGSPPGIAGCVLANPSAFFGDTWCCTENDCVAQPDQDKECKKATPHRYQCPPEGSGSVAPPPGCTDGGSGPTTLERFSCCP